MEMTNFTSVRAVLRNNYWSRNLIDPYSFCQVLATSFTRPFLAGRRARAGHETSKDDARARSRSISRPHASCALLSTKSVDLIGHITFLPWGQLDGCSVTRP